jgi:hypothetical protein
MSTSKVFFIEMKLSKPITDCFSIIGNRSSAVCSGGESGGTTGRFNLAGAFEVWNEIE